MMAIGIKKGDLIKNPGRLFVSSRANSEARRAAHPPLNECDPVCVRPGLALPVIDEIMYSRFMMGMRKTPLHQRESPVV
jgi:hypothetical protein